MDISRPRNPLRRAAVALAFAAALPWSITAHAQAYPSKPIRMIVPLAAGSAVDVAARLLASKMSQNMGQQIVVENIVGAAGIIGASQLAKAAPDGYTIGGFNDSILTMVPNLNPNTPFNPISDFVHVSRVAVIEFSVAVASNSPWKSAADLVAAAKAAPGRYTYASGGNGSPQHMGGALFAAHTGIDIKHVPYRGASQAAQDVLGSQVEAFMVPMTLAEPNFRAGKLKLIGVAAPQRVPWAKDIPTLAEQGIDSDGSIWLGVLAPAKAPAEAINAVNKALNDVIADPAVSANLYKSGFIPRGGSVQDFNTYLQREFERMGKVIRDAGIKAD